MEEPDKFIQFGCWNNLNTKKGKSIGCLENVTDLLDEYLSSQEKKPNFLVISGDNYYPDKQKDESDGSKKKFIFQEKLMKGFSLLPDKLQIHMILGNHDLETTFKKPNLFIDNLESPEQKDCKILQLEIQAKKPNVEYDFFKDIMLKNGTLLLMIDTSIYDVDSDKYLPCYNVFFQQASITDIHQPFTSIEELRDYQSQQIMGAIEKHSGIVEHIIIVGHHPIVQLKSKDDTVQFTSDISFSFKPVLQSIYERTRGVNYYYLCSDLHLFQQGKIELNFDSLGTMAIQQYIVGTGGTKLDDPLPQPYTETTHEQYGIKYILEEEKAQCGFLECIVDESGPIFRPILLESSSGGKLKKLSKTKKSKLSKTKKRKVKK